MNHYLLGELCALGVAVSDATACTCFNEAEKKISLFSVNILKMLVAMLSITAFRAVTCGGAALSGVPLWALVCLGLSGLLGYAFGDFFYFASFLYIPYRLSMMIFYSSPIVTSLVAWWLYGQQLQAMDWLGILLVITGLCLALFARQSEESGGRARSRMGKGVFLAVLGMLGQAAGVLLSNQGLSLLEGMTSAALAASQIRTTAGFLGLFAAGLLCRKMPAVLGDMRHPREVGLVVAGGVCGCAVGATLTLQSLRYIPVGISLAITSLSPIIVLPLTVLLLHERIKPLEALGAGVCIAGVVLLSI